MSTVPRGFPYADIVSALLLTDGPLEPTPAVAGLAQACAETGFTAFVAPWHAVRIEPGRVLLGDGEVFDAAGSRPVPLWTSVAPRAVLPAAPTDIEGLAAITRGIADACPDAVLTWTPELSPWTGRAGTERALRESGVRVARPAAAVLPAERRSVSDLAGGGVVVRETHRRIARGGRRYADFAAALAALAVLDGRDDAEVVASAEIEASLDLRFFALVSGVAPVQVLISDQAYARRWPHGWARHAELPSLNGRTPRPAQLPQPVAIAAEDVVADDVREQVHAIAHDVASALCTTARLADLPGRRRALPWLTLDLVVPDEPRGAVTLLDVELFCEARADARVTAQAASPLLAELYVRCLRPRAVLLPHPELDLVATHAIDDVPFVASLLPQLGPWPCLVDTTAWPGATFAYRDERMTLPTGADALAMLGRVIGSAPHADIRRRYVEPGVGRTCLIDNLTVRGRPEFHDARVLGIGLTPYSDRGYAMVGPHVDGLTSMLRAELRRVTAERLEHAGCRTSLTTAVIALPGLETTMPDYTTEPAALVVRAFRSVLRVKQLDPLATPYLSPPQHRPLLWEFLSDPRWEVDGRPGVLGRTAGRLGGTVRSQRMISDSAADPRVSAEAARRREVIALYAPLLVRFASRRLAIELGRDPDTEPVTTTEYVEWFASRVGGQLAIMRSERFLHDHHQPGVGRPDPNLAYSLGQSNVSLPWTPPAVAGPSRRTAVCTSPSVVRPRAC